MFGFQIGFSEQPWKWLLGCSSGNQDLLQLGLRKVHVEWCVSAPDRWCGDSSCVPVLYAWKRAWGAETPERLWIKVVGSIDLVFRPDAIGTGKLGGCGAGMVAAVSRQWALCPCNVEPCQLPKGEPGYRKIGTHSSLTRQHLQSYQCLEAVLCMFLTNPYI